METPSNFGNNGARPSNPELLDYLAARLVESGGRSRRCIARSCCPRCTPMSSEDIAANDAVDPDNRMLWRANLAAHGCGDAARLAAVRCGQPGSDSRRPARETRRQEQASRTVYGFVSRRKLDPCWRCSIFPIRIAPASSAWSPMCRCSGCFMMNSSFVEEQARGLAKRLSGRGRGAGPAGVRLLFGRAPRRRSRGWAWRFAAKSGWTEYAQVLLELQ